VQRLEVLVAVMLARERCVLADAETGGCTALAAALATLPSDVLEIVADAVAALVTDDDGVTAGEGQCAPFTSGAPLVKPPTEHQSESPGGSSSLPRSTPLHTCSVL
jgi:hypothetical protein